MGDDCRRGECCQQDCRDRCFKECCGHDCDNNGNIIWIIVLIIIIYCLFCNDGKGGGLFGGLF